MDIMSKKTNSILTGVTFSSVLLMIVGILFISKPGDIIEMISSVIGVVIIIFGILALIRNYTLKSKLYKLDLVYGIICIVSGTILIRSTEAVASVLPIILGVWMIINSCFKIQSAFLLKEQNNKIWIRVIVMGIATLALGIFFVINPFKGAEFLMQLIGYMLVLYSAIDIISAVTLKKTIKKNK